MNLEKTRRALPVLLLAVAGFCSLPAEATPYSGTAPACPAASGTTCRIDLRDFMKSKYSYTFNGVTYTFDGSSKDSTANSASTSAFMSVPKLVEYNPSTNQQIDHGPWAVNHGFVNHPAQSNVIMFSKNGTASEGLEFFRWGGNPDNSVYVQSEPPSPGNFLFKSFGTNTSAPVVNWRHRGFFWFDQKFDVSFNSPGLWLGPRYNIPGLYYDNLGNPNSEKVGVQNWHLEGKPLFTYVNYFPSLSAAWINEYGGHLPTPLEVVELVLGGLDTAGQAIWWEKYYYARQKLANGTYNNFGLIKWQNSHRTIGQGSPAGVPRCQNGVPPAGYSNAACGDFNLMIQYNEPNNIFRRANQTGYASVAAYLNAAYTATRSWKNDVKITKRSVAESTVGPAAPNAASYMPHLRGGFVPQGIGNDAHGDVFVGSPTQSGDWVYLENSLVDQDWYIYPSGKDPLYPQGSPVNYCRDGYQYLGSMVVSKSHNGLTGQVEDTGSPHWIILCGTSQDAYLNAANSGEPSCDTGYTNRTWYGNPSHAAVWGCRPGQGCLDLSAKNYVNFCVKNNQCAGGLCNPTPSSYP